jgi:hypothetical protein
MWFDSPKEACGLILQLVMIKILGQILSFDADSGYPVVVRPNGMMKA